MTEFIASLPNIESSLRATPGDPVSILPPSNKTLLKTLSLKHAQTAKKKDEQVSH